MHQPAVKTLTDRRQIQALAQPSRVDVLDALREPDSAAGVARAIGRTRQQVNYHVKELERAGLVRHAGERRRGNFVEQLYQSVARRFVIAPDFAWDPGRLAETLADQVSLAQLSDLGGRLQHDATALLDRAASSRDKIPSVSIEMEVRFDSDESRAAFMREYMQTLKSLLKKYGTRKGTPFRIITAAYLRLEEDQ